MKPSCDRLQEAIQQLDRATDTPELVRATQTLCNLENPDAAPTLVKVLGFNNPAVAAIATQGLIALGRDIVPILLESMDARNYGARAWVVKALAALKDPRGLGLLERALHSDIAPSVRRSAARGLADLKLDGTTEMVTNLHRCLQALFKAAEDDEWVVRYSAAFGLEQRLLQGQATDVLTEQARSRLNHLASEAESVKVVRLRAQQALQRLTVG